MQCTGCLDSIHCLGTLGNLYTTATAAGLNFQISMQPCFQVCITHCAYASQEITSHFVDSVPMQLGLREHTSCAICDFQMFGLKTKKAMVWELAVQRCHVAKILPLLHAGMGH